MPLHAIHDKYARYRNIIIVKGLTYVTAGSVTQKAAANGKRLADGMSRKNPAHTQRLLLSIFHSTKCFTHAYMCDTPPEHDAQPVAHLRRGVPHKNGPAGDGM